MKHWYEDRFGDPRRSMSSAEEVKSSEDTETFASFWEMEALDAVET